MRRDRDAILSLQRFFAGFLLDPWDIRRAVETGQEPARPYALIEQVGASGSDGAPGRQDITIAYSINLYLPRPGDGRRATAADDALELREQIWQAFKIGPDARRPISDLVPLLSYEPRLEIQRVSVRASTAGTWRLGDGVDLTGPLDHDATVADVQSELDLLLGDGNAVVWRRADQIFDVVFGGELAGVNVGPLILDAAALVGGTPAVTTVLQGAPAPWRTASDFMRVEDFSQTTIHDEDDPTLVMVAVALRCAFRRGSPLPLDAMLLQRLSATTGIGG